MLPADIYQIEGDLLLTCDLLQTLLQKTDSGEVVVGQIQDDQSGLRQGLLDVDITFGDGSLSVSFGCPLRRAKKALMKHNLFTLTTRWKRCRVILDRQIENTGAL